jgi:MazG family protein
MPDRIKNKTNHYEMLRSLINVLREECPWDNDQDLSSLRRYTLEEVHEVLEAIDTANAVGDWQPLKSELGDLLFHIIFYARIAEEENQFDLGDIIDALVEKMIYRHPHVFKNTKADDLTEQWNQLKDAENESAQSLMDNIPPLPALKYAQKQQQRAARVGFDWDNASDVILKMREELEEFEYEVANRSSKERLEDEFGDVLFTLANLARKLDLDAELCLMHSNRKFGNRFRLMEALAEDRQTALNDMNLDSLESLYHEAKNMHDRESPE